MKRNVNLDEITDGQRYTSGDLVRISCNDCSGCHKCCTGMGNSLVLDPYDIYCLTTNLGREFASFLNKELALNIVDGITLPNIVMNDKCSFLNADGRCSIHGFRPGICRLFPLARIYENESFAYVHQINECDYPTKSKVKVKNWLGIPDLKDYEKYVCTWHYFLKEMEEFVSGCNDSNLIKTLNMLILNTFYITAYANESFYDEFYSRLDEVKKKLGLI